MDIYWQGGSPVVWGIKGSTGHKPYNKNVRCGLGLRLNLQWTVSCKRNIFITLLSCDLWTNIECIKRDYSCIRGLEKPEINALWPRNHPCHREFTPTMECSKEITIWFLGLESDYFYLYPWEILFCSVQESAVKFLYDLCTHLSLCWLLWRLACVTKRGWSWGQTKAGMPSMNSTCKATSMSKALSCVRLHLSARLGVEQGTTETF